MKMKRIAPGHYEVRGPNARVVVDRGTSGRWWVTAYANKLWDEFEASDYWFTLGAAKRWAANQLAAWGFEWPS